MVELDPPAERECQRCGRQEVWDSDAPSWRIRTEDAAGSSHCIHEWNITGEYNPIRE